MRQVYGMEKPKPDLRRQLRFAVSSGEWVWNGEAPSTTPLDEEEVADLGPSTFADRSRAERRVVCLVLADHVRDLHRGGGRWRQSQIPQVAGILHRLRPARFDRCAAP